jgi:low temperature requirement protein LtrA
MHVPVLRLFRLPRRPAQDGERHATWLELFFDLMFAVALSAVTARLPDSGVPTWTDLGATLGVFFVVLSAWLGQAFYDTRFDPNDVVHRLLVLLSAAGAAAITLGAGDLPAGYLLPVGYLTVRGALIVMYLRVLVTDRSSMDLAVVYLCGFGVSWLLWLTSLALPAPDRPWLWIGALAVDLATPWMGRPWLMHHSVHPTHLSERIAQFTIILVGVALVSLRDALPSSGPTTKMLVAGAAALVVTSCIWWVYTTFLTSQLALPRFGNGSLYAYIHLPLNSGILFAGWALGRVVALTGDRHEETPLVLRSILALSIITWMLGGLAANRFALGLLSRRRLVQTAVGIAAVAAAGLAKDPNRLLVLLALILVGYAAAVTTTIRKSAARSP